MPMNREAPHQKKIKRKAPGYGWVPDLPDQRDFLYSAMLRVPPAFPSHADLRPFCSKVEDQGNLGSCTSNALAGALEFLEMKDNVHYAVLSRLFIYYNERVIEHSVKSDTEPCSVTVLRR